MKTKIILLLTSLLLFNIVNAQRVIGGAGFLRAGYMGAPGSSDVFEQIAPATISGFTNNYFYVGGEGYFRMNRAIIGLEGSTGFQPAYSTGNRYAEPFMGSGYFKIGVVAAGDKRFWFYPTVGVGASALVLAEWRNTIDEYFDNWHSQILVNPSFDFGLNADFPVTRTKKEKPGFGGFIMGIRAGYRVSYSTNNWKDEEWTNLNDMPSYQQNVFYVTLAIGGGWFVQKDEAKNAKE